MFLGKFVNRDFREIVQNHVVECRSYWIFVFPFLIAIGVMQST